MVWVDREVITSGCVLRARQEGDLIQPLGMGGKSIKVTDLMINEKIPAPYRADWPVIAGESSILWVPGGRLSRDARITKETQAVLEFRFVRRKT